jgi:hypothetical protein
VISAINDPGAYVAGSTPLNRKQLRFSGDTDIFNDSAERAGVATGADSAMLEHLRKG